MKKRCHKYAVRSQALQPEKTMDAANEEDPLFCLVQANPFLIHKVILYAM